MELDKNMLPAEWKDAVDQLTRLRSEIVALAKKCNATICVDCHNHYNNFSVSVFNLAEQKKAGEDTYLSYSVMYHDGGDKPSEYMYEYSVNDD